MTLPHWCINFYVYLWSFTTSRDNVTEFARGDVGEVEEEEGISRSRVVNYDYVKGGIGTVLLAFGMETTKQAGIWYRKPILIYLWQNQIHIHEPTTLALYAQGSIRGNEWAGERWGRGKPENKIEACINNYTIIIWIKDTKLEEYR